MKWHVSLVSGCAAPEGILYYSFPAGQEICTTKGIFPPHWTKVLLDRLISKVVLLRALLGPLSGHSGAVVS